MRNSFRICRDAKYARNESKNEMNAKIEIGGRSVSGVIQSSAATETEAGEEGHGEERSLVALRYTEEQ